MTDTATPPAAESTPPLTPMSLPMLLARIEHEWSTRKRIFDLPTARFWKPDPDIDLSFEFLGRPAATPVGPAAGPHSQMAQNIVLSWLGGARLFELKTVQVLDDLEIARPCIDMQTIGYNIEWSQELLVHESLEEYVKAWMIIEMLQRWEPISDYVGRPEDGGPGPHVFDMSVGYDLAGHPIRQGRRLHRRDARRDRRDRAVACPDPRRLGVRPVPRPRVPDAHLRHDHPVDVPRMPTRRDRGDHQAPHRAPRHRRHRQAQPDPARARRCERDRPRHARLRVRPTGAEGIRGGPSVRSCDHADRRAPPFRPRPRPPIRHQAHQHTRGPQPQGMDARRDDVPVGRTAPRARHRGARPSWRRRCPVGS